MPLYDYKCKVCAEIETLMFKIDEAPEWKDCSICGSGVSWKQISAPGFILKGTGWYKTDFKGDKPS